jgi:hypothetical protein
MVPDVGGLGRYTDAGLADRATFELIIRMTLMSEQRTPCDGTEILPSEFATWVRTINGLVKV